MPYSKSVFLALAAFFLLAGCGRRHAAEGDAPPRPDTLYSLKTRLHIEAYETQPVDSLMFNSESEPLLRQPRFTIWFEQKYFSDRAMQKPYADSIRATHLVLALDTVEAFEAAPAGGGKLALCIALPCDTCSADLAAFARLFNRGKAAALEPCAKAPAGRVRLAASARLAGGRVLADTTSLIFR